MEVKKNMVLKYDDMTDKQKKLAKELVIERLKSLPPNIRISIG